MLPSCFRCVTAVLCVLVTIAPAADAAQLRQVTAPMEFPSEYTHIESYYTPVWSRDGQSLVVAAAGMYGSPVPGPYYELFESLMAVDLGGNRLESPRWGGIGVSRPSPDPAHARYAVWCHVNLTCVGVAIIDPREPPHAQYPCIPGASAPAWSPDGQTIAAATYNGLQAFSPSGAMITQLTTRTGDETPAWSPHGNAIVFSSIQSGTRDLWIKDLNTGVERQLTSDAADDTWPAWSPDGGWIAFASNRSGSRSIWAIAALGGEPVLVADRPWSSAPAWSPDGRSLAFESAGQIWIATDLPDVIVTVEVKSWSRIKILYRDSGR